MVLIIRQGEKIMQIKKRLRLNTWISLGAIVLMLFTLGWSFWEVYRADRNVLLTDEMRKVATERTFTRDDYLLNRNERAKVQWYAKSEIFRALLESAIERFTGTEDRALLQEAQKNFDATFSLFSAILEEHKRKEPADRKKTVFGEIELRRIREVFLKANALNENINMLHESSSRAVTRSQHRGIIAIVLFVIGSVIAIVVNSIFTSRIVAKRISALNKGIEIIGGGNVDYRIDVVGNDALSALARASNAMVTNLKEIHEYAESIINTVREPLIVLDQDLRVVTVSRSFYEVFKVKPEETVGQLIYDLGNKQWDIPKLRDLLETILPQKTTFDNYEVKHNFATIGRRIMLLNARQIERGMDKERIILLAIEDITERKEIEAGLEKTRKELEVTKQAEDETREYAESIINTVREPLIVLNQDLRVVTVSRSFYEVFKVNPEETVGQLIYDLGNKQWNIPKLRELLETILPQKATFDNYEVEHDFATIGRRIMLLNARQIQRAGGKERIILLAIEDITERKATENLLAESEERYRRIFETANDGILLLEKRKGNIIQTNLAAEKMLGYSKEECIGKNLQDIGVSVDMSDFPTLMQALDKSGIINYKDVTVKNKSGQYIDTDIYMVDRARLVQCNIRDVTERKLEEEKLKKSEEFARSILQTVDEGFIVIDLEYRVIAANRAYLNSVGKSLKEVTGNHCYELSHHTDKPCCEDGTTVCPVTLTFKTGEHYSSIHTHYDHAGAPVYVKTKSYPMKDESGKVVSAIEVINDISENKKLEDQLRHSQKMEAVGTLAGGIAHDFNNILNVIMGYGGMVYDSLEAGSPSKEKMNEVLAAAERAANLTKRLLVFSRKQVVAVKPVNINELILGVQKMLVRMLREDIDFKLKLDLAAKPLIVLADSGQIEQVLMNLVTNARDVMPEGGSLTIGTGLQELDDEYVAVYGYVKTGRYALITVMDTGQGMNAETQKKIFEPFFTTKGIGEGTGLGLSISYGIIKQHSGYINVYSEPGQGTVFKIYLPLSEEAVSPDKKTAAAVPAKGGNETILVAEDDASVMQLTRIVLESFGYSVITAKDGDDAITKFMENRERISLVLLDMIMPKKNGKEVSETIRKVSPRIKILFSSGYTMDIIKTKELTDAGFDFISKPVLPRDLLLKVREVLDR